MNDKNVAPLRPPVWPHRNGNHFHFLQENQAVRPQAPPAPRVQPKNVNPVPQNPVAINPRVNVRIIPIQHPHPLQIQRNHVFVIPMKKIAALIAIAFSAVILFLIVLGVTKRGANEVPASASYALPPSSSYSGAPSSSYSGSSRPSYSGSSRDRDSSQTDRLIRAIDRFLNTK